MSLLANENIFMCSGVSLLFHLFELEKNRLKVT